MCQGQIAQQKLRLKECVDKVETKTQPAEDAPELHGS